MARILRGEKAPLTVFGLVRRSHGTAMAKYDPLILRFGDQAAPHVETLTRAMSRGTLTGSAATLEEAELARAKLMPLANRLPQGDRARVGLALVRDGQTIMERMLGDAKDYAEGVEDYMAELASRRAWKSLALQALESARLVVKPGAVLAQLGRDFQLASPELQQLWERYWAIVPLESPFMTAAARSAAEHAPAIADLLRNRELKATQAIWGHLVNPRGVLGEGYALLNPIWLSELDGLLASARKLALGFGPGHTVRYFTQVEHGILLNGRAGPDAVVAVVNQKAATIRVPNPAQVKVATSSEAAAQSVKDAYRSAGLDKLGPVLPYYSLRLAKNEELRTFRLLSDVDERLYVINAAQGRLPSADVELLKKLAPFEERGLDLSVTQFTHLTISLVEAAIKAAK
jgi:hypothetical protein